MQIDNKQVHQLTSQKHNKTSSEEPSRQELLAQIKRKNGELQIKYKVQEQRKQDYQQKLQGYDQKRSDLIRQIEELQQSN